ncbi:hypothetical protein RRF57_008069 [Xylaria bambusicola]|uniref:Uncharacterized protein n=1 Tax=Xylaria bambusicola TaxID=326684 RepID=A0AAN7UH57_9PEZI
MAMGMLVSDEVVGLCRCRKPASVRQELSASATSGGVGLPRSVAIAEPEDEYSATPKADVSASMSNCISGRRKGETKAHVETGSN